MKNNCQKFIDNLNLYDGHITYNEFNIDEDISFAQQEDSYKEDILQIQFGARFTLHVGFFPEADPEGHFLVQGIKDYDWTNPVAKKKCRSLASLKKAIEKIAKFLSDENKKMEMNKRKTFVDDLNIYDGYVIYNEFDVDENLPFDKQKKFPTKDALFIKFGENYILHVGWVSEFKPKATF